MSGDQKVKVENFSTDEEDEEVKISAEMMASMTVSRPHTQVRTSCIIFLCLLISNLGEETRSLK